MAAEENPEPRDMDDEMKACWKRYSGNDFRTVDWDRYMSAKTIPSMLEFTSWEWNQRATKVAPADIQNAACKPSSGMVLPSGMNSSTVYPLTLQPNEKVQSVLPPQKLVKQLLYDVNPEGVGFIPALARAQAREKGSRGCPIALESGALPLLHDILRRIMYYNVPIAMRADRHKKSGVLEHIGGNKAKKEKMLNSYLDSGDANAIWNEVIFNQFFISSELVIVCPFDMSSKPMFYINWLLMTFVTGFFCRSYRATPPSNRMADRMRI